MNEQEAMRDIIEEGIELGAGDYVDVEALKVAVKALEKQIPKKPNIWGDGYADGEMIYDMYDCPNCEKSYEIDCEKYDYCPACGQRIDWSEEEQN